MSLKIFVVVFIFVPLFLSSTMVSVQEYSQRFKEKPYSSRHVIVKKGALPLIITAGHGGTYRPSSIPDRKREGTLILGDMYTKEIAEGIGKGIQKHYEKASPHVILNLVSRRKADVNRPIEEGTETKKGAYVWKEYHNHVQDAVDCVLKDYNYGLLIDIHGHTHSHSKTELGYLLDPTDFKLNAEAMDQIVLEKSSIQSLAKRQAQYTEPHQLLRKVFGDSISSAGQITVVPSTVDPEPDNVYYFSGGYTTQKYRSSTNNSNKKGLDVVQVEIPKELRHTEKGRQCIIDAIVNAMIPILDNYYIIKSRL